MSHDAAHAEAYFPDAVVKPDHDTSEQELPGIWQERFAELLGLAGR